MPVVCEYRIPFALFTKTTIAPAIRPPEKSLTVPRIAPVDASWQKVEDAKKEWQQTGTSSGVT
jgi:hypothetical protein